MTISAHDEKTALNMLSNVWGGFSLLGASGAEFLEQFELPGETALQTCLRVAGIQIDAKEIRAFDYGLVRCLVARREVEIATRHKE